MLGVRRIEPAPAAPDPLAILAALTAKLEALKPAPAPDLSPALGEAVALLAEAVRALQAAPAPVVRVAAPDQSPLAAALAHLKPAAPCAYHFSITARDAQGKISEMVARPLPPEKDY